MQGQQIGNWTIEEPIDEGGMGMVWKGRHNRLGHPAAIKVMHPHLTTDPEFGERFSAEAAALAHLQHPHIVGLVDFIPQGSIFYLVMPFIEGQSLEQRLAAQGGPLPLAEVFSIAQDILQALDYAHQQAVIHRDVKPSNILLNRAGQAYLVDFGIALRMGQRRRTSTGRAIGTAHCMSPEQIRNPRLLDHRTDVYSFGCVLYEMLTGRPPFDAQAEEGDTDFLIKEQHLKQTPVPPRQLNGQVSAELEAVVLRALAKDPNERFNGCGEFARTLNQLEKGAGSLVFCAQCGAQNPVTEPTRLPQTICSNCRKPVTQPIKRGSSAGWILALCILGMFALAGFVGWAVEYDELRQARVELSSQASTLERDRAIRSKLAELWPVTASDIKFYNSDGKGQMLGSYSTNFYQSSARYIHWELALQNNAVGIKNAEGTLKVRYIAPSGLVITTDRSPVGETQESRLNITNNRTEDGGIGKDQPNWQPGTYRIQFRWGDRLIGQQTFTVQ